MTLAVVLVSPKHPGNVGSAARAMLNMGASELRLVAPRCDHLSSEARALAVHAAGLLENARVYGTLAEALADRDVAVGTSARERSDLPPPRTPATLRPMVRAAARPALVFGPEETGLSSDDLQLCQATVRIPTGEYASLNLAQAVLLVCYEFLQGGDDTVVARKVADRAEYEGMYAHLYTTMLEVGYTDDVRGRHTMRLWRAALDRAQLSTPEVRLVRGLLQQARWAARQPDRDLPPMRSMLVDPSADEADRDMADGEAPLD